MGELHYETNKLDWEQDVNPKLRNSCLGKKKKSLYLPMCRVADYGCCCVVVSYILLTKV